MVQRSIAQKRQAHHKSRGVKTTRPNPRMDPFPVPDAAAAAVVVVVQAIVDIVAEVVAGMGGTVVESAAAAAVVVVEQTAVGLESRYDRTAKVPESEVAEKE